MNTGAVQSVVLFKESKSLHLNPNDFTNMKITNIPFPRFSLKQYGLISLVIAITVSFILIVFQPFGTARFTHSHKNLILAGYGISIFFTMSIFYFFSKKIFHKNKEDQWTIIYEMFDMLLVLILSLIASYIYSIEIFDGNYDMKRMFYFLFNAFKVAIIPVLGCLGYLYFRWKDVIRASIQTSADDKMKGKLTLILGNNKSDQVEATTDEILMAQAQSNYVMLHILKNGKTQRHILRSTLKQIKEQLDDALFIQAHRSYIINQSKIKNISGNKSKAQVQIEGYEKNIPISRNIYDTLKSASN